MSLAHADCTCKNLDSRLSSSATTAFLECAQQAGTDVAVLAHATSFGGSFKHLPSLVAPSCQYLPVLPLPAEP